MNDILYVKSDGKEEFLNEVHGFELYEEVSGDKSISFAAYDSPNNPSYNLLEAEAIVVVGEFEYRIKQIREYIGYKEIFAQSTFFDLITKRQELSFSGFREFDQFLEYIFEGTDWTYSSDIDEEMSISNYGKDNIIKLVDKLNSEFESEFVILPNNEVFFTKESGVDKGAQYRFGNNVSYLSKFEDTSNLRTVIYGYGAGDLVVKYVSPNIEIFGEHIADPVEDERFTIEENFYEYVRKKLIDYPELSVELETVELLDKELGEHVWLIYEPLGIEFKTRVLGRRTSLIDGKLRTTSVTLGTTIPQSMSDLEADQDAELEEEKAKTISRFEMTDDRITLEVEKFDESIAGIIIRVGEVEIFAESLEDEMDARFKVTSERISAEVRDLNNVIDGVKTDATSNFDILAGRINAKADYSEVTELGKKINNVEFDMNAMDGRISQKVSSTDYNGSTVVSMINQTASSIKIEAKNIELKGAVTVLSELSGDLGSISAGDISGVNINIDQNVSIGETLYLGGRAGQFRGRVVLSSNAEITGSNGSINIDSNSLQFPGTQVNFGGAQYVDFGNTTVYGLDNFPDSYTEGLGFGYSPGSNRLYVRIFGADQGYIQLT